MSFKLSLSALKNSSYNNNKYNKIKIILIIIFLNNYNIFVLSFIDYDFVVMLVINYIITVLIVINFNIVVLIVINIFVIKSVFDFLQQSIDSFYELQLLLIKLFLIFQCSPCPVQEFVWVCFNKD